jgi:hypothetical protein
VQLADELLGIAHEVDPSLDLRYNKYYIGLSKDDRPFNFLQFRPRKNQINLEVHLPQSDDIDTKIDQSGLEALGYDTKWERYRLSLHKEDILKHKPLLKELMQAAHQSRSL